MAAAMDNLAEDPGDQSIRRNVTEHVADLVTWLIQHGGQVPAHSALAAAYAGIRMFAGDVMVFAGVNPEEAFSDAPPTRRDD
ncbi:hypothetical protein [Jidongwangia harbinensis]|uniref:hypothetical protein n=1 Tax=Jidongwangia harbinensis TaxID=2878561 RepID=UPI001CD9B218|nr:hypothetical protein [Jidongwangia harbinensis]MCA2218875.1 hypothetical protein [Jidongwangia harbinensis]